MARPGPGPLMDSYLSDTQELTQELNRHLEDHHAHHRERRGTYAVGRFSAYWTVDASKTTFNMTMTGLTTGWYVLRKAFISIPDTLVYSRAVNVTCARLAALPDRGSAGQPGTPLAVVFTKQGSNSPLNSPMSCEHLIDRLRHRPQNHDVASIYHASSLPHSPLQDRHWILGRGPDELS